MWWSVGRIRINKVAFLIAAFVLLLLLLIGLRLVFTSGAAWFVFFVLPFFYITSRQRDHDKRKREPGAELSISDLNAKPKRENGRYAVGDDGELIEVEPPSQAEQRRQPGRDDVV